MPEPELQAHRSSRVLGLDPGRRWIGVAISDDERRLALPLCTVDRRAEADDGAALIRERLGPEGASLVVVGVPLRPDGSDDAQSRDFRALGSALADALQLPCRFSSERFSNPLAAEAASESPKPGAGRRRGARSPARQQARRVEAHALAAANILQRWLDSERAASARADAVRGDASPGPEGSGVGGSGVGAGA